jgi:hypothetical protein
MDNIKNIIAYSKGHDDTQLTTLSASSVGIGVLDDMQKKLTLASEELQRMEDEGGIPLDIEQTKKMSAYSKAGQRIRRILLIAKKMLPPRAANLPLFQTRKEH